MSKEKIINLTLHELTPELEKEGVFDLADWYKRIVRESLLFEELPSKGEIELRVSLLVNCLLQYGGSSPERQLEEGQKILVGGATYLIPKLVKRLKEAGFKPVGLFTKRILKERSSKDGSVVLQERQIVFGGFVEC